MSQSVWGQLRWGDFILGAFFLLTAGVILLFSWSRPAYSGNQVRIVSGGQEIGIYELNQDQELTVALDGYQNTIQIRAGAASVISATCPDQYCVRHEPISRSGETILCLPARLVITIMGSEEAALDGISR